MDCHLEVNGKVQTSKKVRQEGKSWSRASMQPSEEQEVYSGQLSEWKVKQMHPQSSTWFSRDSRSDVL